MGIRFYEKQIAHLVYFLAFLGFCVDKVCSKKLSLFKVLNSVLIRAHDPLDDDITFGIWLRFFLNN